MSLEFQKLKPKRYSFNFNSLKVPKEEIQTLYGIKVLEKIPNRGS
jgi:hypothetical protein